MKSNPYGPINLDTSHEPRGLLVHRFILGDTRPKTPRHRGRDRICRICLKESTIHVQEWNQRGSSGGWRPPRQEF